MSTGPRRIPDLEEDVVLSDKDQFLFYQNSTKKTKRITKGNMANSGGGLRGRFIDAATGNDVGLSASLALTNANLAAISAEGAQDSADGKNRVFYQTSAPASSVFTGYINGTTLNAGAPSGVSIYVGAILTGSGVSAGTKIIAYGTGTGGAGTYIVDISQTVSSTSITANPFKINDIWYDTDDNYKTYICTATTPTWTASFTPFPGVDASGNVTGLVKATGTEPAFALLATKFQIIDPANPTTKTDANVPFEIISGTVRIKNAVITSLDAAKITSGFISSKVIELSDSSAYIQSSNFIETWVTGRSYVVTKITPDQQSKVKVLQNDGSYLVYNCQTIHTSTGTFATELSAGKWALASPQPSVQGFRIVGNGSSEMQEMVIRGTVYATSGYFGTTSNAALIDTNGLVIGSTGRIKSSGLTYSSSGPGAGTKGFFLGNTGTVDEFFIGDPSKYLRWDGTNLSVSGNIVGGSTVGASTDSGAGLTINSPYGIRQGNSSNQGVLTITGGYGNGVQAGAQIDLCGSGATGYSGALILQAGSGSSSQIRLSTNTTNATLATGQVGSIRATINAEGLFKIERNPVSADGITNIINVDAGNLHVVSNVGIGRAPEQTNTTGATDSNVTGKLHVKTEIAVYNNLTPPTKSITLTGSSGDVSATTFTTSSSKKVKTNIKKLKSGLETIDKLKPVSFKRKGTKQQDIGLIAEEVDKVLPVIVKHNDKNEAEGLDYSKLTVVLINAVKELSVEVDRLKNKIK